MYKTNGEAAEFMEAVKGSPIDPERVEAVVCAPALHLAQLTEAAEDSPIHIGAQTMHSETEGAFTGEISPVQLKSVGVTHVIIGHSERRQLFGETDESVNAKVLAAAQHDLRAIVCVGETLEQREEGSTGRIVEQQVERAFEGLSTDDAVNAVIAYEPIWAIGTGKTATSEDANEVCGIIRGKIAALYNEATADSIRILYGGSVKPANIGELLATEHIDGALVGGASLEAESFIQLMEAGLHAEN